MDDDTRHRERKSGPGVLASAAAISESASGALGVWTAASAAPTTGVSEDPESPTPLDNPASPMRIRGRAAHARPVPGLFIFRKNS